MSFDDEKGVAAFESAARKMDHVYFANITSADRTEHELTRVYGLKNQQQEELVYFWAKKKDTHYVRDPIFQSNFLYPVFLSA